jgi:hypothetical protein
MKNISQFGLALTACALAAARADLLVYEGFDYPVGDLTENGNGTGWQGPWFDTGNPVVATSTSLGYADAIGNTLNTSGGAVNTSDGSEATTISGRELGERNSELWISLMIQPLNSGGDFVGVSFYQDDLTLENARFAIEHQEGKDVQFALRADDNDIRSPNYATTIGQAVFAVVHLVPGGGEGEGLPDRMDVYFDPVLSSEPTTADFSVDVDGLGFDRVRIAGQNARACLVDELRIGETFSDVSPFTEAEDPDSDLDGLTDAQENILGLDPMNSDAAFIAALRANPGFFDLRSEDEILDVRLGEQELLPIGNADGDFDYAFQIIRADGSLNESEFIPLETSSDPSFFRLQLNTP